METRGLPSRWSGYARRLPSSLKDLSGPAAGMVVLPLHVAWSGRRAYDVSDERQRLMLYTLLLAEAQLAVSCDQCWSCRYGGSQVERRCNGPTPATLGR